ncbi:MAG: glycosyltransferase family 4 protein [Bacteroidales bacterium]|nr:glycosyltransferase family 4 protein [Bacteroidales bacterium]
MKILQLTNKVPVPPRDGGSIASYRLSLGLAQLDNEVTVLAMNTSKHFIDEDLWSPIAKKSGFKLITVAVNTEISIFKALINLAFSKLPYTASRFLSNEYRKTLIKLLQSGEFDYVIIENLYPILYLDSIRKNTEALVVMRAHNMEHEIWQRTADQVKGIKKLYFRMLAKRIRTLELSALNKYDFLIPITIRDEKAFNKLGNTKPSLALPTGVIIKESCEKIKISNTLQIAHLGALDWSPNQEGILWFLEQVWPLVKLQYSKAEFHLAGRNAPDWFIRRIKKYDITYHGEVESAGDFIRHFPVHIVPLWMGSGMRIKIVEAMAQARVIVTTSIGVEGINAIDGESIIIRDNPTQFSEALINLHENPTLIKEISQNAFTFVRNHFENKKLIENLIQFLNDHGSNS